MIYVTTPCEKNATIICQEFAIPRSLENCKDETNPCNQVGQHIPSDPLRWWHFIAEDLPKGHADSVRMRVADGVRTWTRCRNPTLAKCGGEAQHLEKSEDLESFGIPECLELDSKAQNTSHWGVPCVIGKVLKRRCRKWPRISHLGICSPSYGQKKARESNWQFDSRPLKVGNRPLPDLRIESAIRRWKDLDAGYKFGLDFVAIRRRSRELWAPKVPGLHPGDALPSHGVKPSWRSPKVKLRN
jgi:hypothetical protein